MNVCLLHQVMVGDIVRDVLIKNFCLESHSLLVYTLGVAFKGKLELARLSLINIHV